MNFRSARRRQDEPDINLIPLIDVLLVILIFLAATTSFTRLNQLKVALPQARADAVDDRALNIAVSREGLYALEGQIIPDGDVDSIAAALLAARRGPEQALVINADAQSPHEAVMRILQAARQVGMPRVNFAARTPQ